MTARLQTPTADMGDYSITESSYGVCVHTGNGGFVAFESASEARLHAAVVLQAADLLDAQASERDSRKVAAGVPA